MNYRVHCHKKHSVTIDDKVDMGKPFNVTVDKSDYDVEIRKVQADGRIKTLMVNHRVCPIEVERRGDGMPVRVYLKGVPFDVEISKVASTRLRAPEVETTSNGSVPALLPGQIVRILAQPGERVEKGAPLLILDAMKMENEVLAPVSGTLKEVHVRSGQVVAKGDLLAEVDIPKASEAKESARKK